MLFLGEVQVAVAARVVLVLVLLVLAGGAADVPCVGMFQLVCVPV